MQLSVMRVTPYHTLQLTCCCMQLSCIKLGQSELSAFCLPVGSGLLVSQVFILYMQHTSGLMADFTTTY